MSELRWHSAVAAAAGAARAGIPEYDPNPAVGCALVSSDGAIIAVGSHRGVGTAHAEVDAITAAGERARGATAVVTMLPCDHIGTTGSCTQALIDAAVVRVVYAHGDPTGHADTTISRLSAAGIEVIGPVAPALGQEVLASWLSPYTTGLPHVVWKIASSLDGHITDRHGASKWLTGEAARDDVQRLRAQAGAIVTSTETVLVDDPALNVRIGATSRQPLRVVIGLREVPAAARIRGTDGSFEHHKTRDVRQVLAGLAARGVHRVLVECGGRLAAALVAEGLVNEIVSYHAGLLLPGGTSLVADLPDSDAPGFVLATAARWRAVDVRIIGDDIRTRWLPAHPVPTTAGA